MRRTKRRGPGPSSVLVTPDDAANVVGIDPHKLTLTATVVDPRGRIVASEHFKVSGGGHPALEAWARQFEQLARWGAENPAHPPRPTRHTAPPPLTGDGPAPSSKRSNAYKHSPATASQAALARPVLPRRAVRAHSRTS